MPKTRGSKMALQHQDENYFNGVNSRRMKLKENSAANSHGKQRTAFGNLSNVQNTRVQPYRSAKLALKEKVLNPSVISLTNVENECLSRPVQAQPAAFSIFADSDTSECSSTKTYKTRVRTRSSERLSHNLQSQLSFPPRTDESSGYNSNMSHTTSNLSTSITNRSYEAMNESLLCNEQLEERFESPMHMSVYAAPEQVESPSKTFESVVLHMVPYETEVRNYLFDLEKRMKPKANFMCKQPDITSTMRLILVDWLVEVAQEYKLENETLFLTAAYVDKFLSYMSVQRIKLQLVGAASMFIAAKYEEIYPPELGEFVYITDNTYSKKQMLKMEMLILKVLNFDMGIPTPLIFLHRYLAHLSISQTSRQAHLATFLLELSLLHVEPYVNCLASVKAASALAISSYVITNVVWSPTMCSCCGWELTEIRTCMMAMVQHWNESLGLPQKAVRQKYQDEKYGSVSQIPPPLDLLPLLSTSSDSAMRYHLPNTMT